MGYPTGLSPRSHNTLGILTGISTTKPQNLRYPRRDLQHEATTLGVHYRGLHRETTKLEAFQPGSSPRSHNTCPTGIFTTKPQHLGHTTGFLMMEPQNLRYPNHDLHHATTLGVSYRDLKLEATKLGVSYRDCHHEATTPWVSNRDFHHEATKLEVSQPGSAQRSRKNWVNPTGIFAAKPQNLRYPNRDLHHEVTTPGVAYRDFHREATKLEVSQPGSSPRERKNWVNPTGISAAKPQNLRYPNRDLHHEVTTPGVAYRDFHHEATKLEVSQPGSAQRSRKNWVNPTGIFAAKPQNLRYLYRDLHHEATTFGHLGYPTGIFASKPQSLRCPNRDLHHARTLGYPTGIFAEKPKT